MSRGYSPKHSASPMGNLIQVEYSQTRESVSIDHLGMREMQQRVFAQRDAP